MWRIRSQMTIPSSAYFVSGSTVRLFRITIPFMRRRAPHKSCSGAQTALILSWLWRTLSKKEKSECFGIRLLPALIMLLRLLLDVHSSLFHIDQFYHVNWIKSRRPFSHSAHWSHSRRNSLPASNQMNFEMDAMSATNIVLSLLKEVFRNRSRRRANEWWTHK